MALRTRKDRADIFTATKAHAQISKERSGPPMVGSCVARVYKTPACWFGVFCSSSLAVLSFSKAHNAGNDETIFFLSEKQFLAGHVMLLRTFAEYMVWLVCARENQPATLPLTAILLSLFSNEERWYTCEEQREVERQNALWHELDL